MSVGQNYDGMKGQKDMTVSSGPVDRDEGKAKSVSRHNQKCSLHSSPTARKQHFMVGVQPA